MIDLTDAIKNSISKENFLYERIIKTIGQNLSEVYLVDWDSLDGEMWGSIVLKEYNHNKRLALFRSNFPLVIAVNDAEVVVKQIFKDNAVFVFIKDWDLKDFTVKSEEVNSNYIKIDNNLNLQPFSMNDFWFSTLFE